MTASANLLAVMPAERVKCENYEEIMRQRVERGYEWPVEKKEQPK